MRSRSEVGLIYAIGLVQGLALVTFPAASSIFTSPRGFAFGSSRYGLMFIPQVVLAVLASSLGPTLARWWTLKRVLQAGLGANLLAMTLLAASRLLIDLSDAAYGVLLVATGSLGFGFGAAVMAMNTFVQAFSPGREDLLVGLGRRGPDVRRRIGWGSPTCAVLTVIHENLWSTGEHELRTDAQTGSPPQRCHQCVRGGERRLKSADLRLPAGQ